MLCVMIVCVMKTICGMIHTLSLGSNIYFNTIHKYCALTTLKLNSGFAKLNQISITVRLLNFENLTKQTLS